ncbi:S8 family serine peptidase [Sporosarcina sp. FSL W8-0480]|uniref:S8 family serine peptidase n=1 Tax=Sporosarcina sp. FSL W8-0480 TaxID=2954701 RepID=UPI0030DD8383
MEKKGFMKVLSSFLAFVLVLSLAMPYTASANSEQTKPFKPNTQSESTMQIKAAIAEQMNLANGGPILHKDLQGLSGDEIVDVIVHLSETPVALQKGITELAGKNFTAAEKKKALQKVSAQQANVKKELKALQVAYEEGFSFNTVLNGFAAKVKVDDLQKLLNIEGVTLVEPDVTVYAFEDETNDATETMEGVKPLDGQVEAFMDTSIGFLGIEALWAKGYEGQGIKVAVLDTGIDADHPDFQGIYKGGKNFIPNSSTYTRERDDDDASETSPVERPEGTPEFNDRGSSFYTSHGTHVAGTIAAIGNNKYGIKGIAPKVDLYAYRVLGAYGSGSNSGIVAAIDYAVEQEMDVINLSLGGGSNTETDAGSFAINNAMLAGTIAVVATGNSGPGRGTMGTPSTARLGIAVGNTTSPEAHYFGDINIEAGDYNLSKRLNLMGTTYGANLSDQLNGEFDLVAVPGIGQASDYEGLDVNGKVVLVSRGEIPFVDKIAAAKDNGAVAIIVHNFAAGTGAPGISGTFLGDDFEFIPTFDMSQTDGDAIRLALAEAEGTISFSNFDKTMTEGDEVNNSSSRGPSTPNFDIKPDVIAPGTNIMSTIPMYKADFPEVTYEQAYTRKTGTSMATPHIAGIVALMKQANPSWDAFDVKVALSNTAKVLDTSKYDVFAQGAGRVQAYQAAHPEILAYAIDTANNDGQTVENKKGTVTFGHLDLKQDISVTKQILVKNENGNGGTYNVTVQVTKGFEDAKITIDKPTFTLSGEQLLNVTLTASAANTKSGDEFLGYINIEGGSTVASLPFAADFGGVAKTEVKDMRITETDLSFNGDGVKDEATLSFTLTGDVSINYIELWDFMNPDGGAYGDGYIGYLHAGTALGAGSYTLRIGGNYTPWEGNGLTKIPDGLYTIDFTALSSSGVIGDYVGPIVVKSTAGTIVGAVEGKTASGQIDDVYIAYQEELEWYNMGYDINTKLKASYEVLHGEEVVSSGPVTLEQDGKFTFKLPELNNEEHSVKVKYEDAAGNKAEELIYKAGDHVVSINHDELQIVVGNTAQLKLVEKLIKADGTEVEEDVTGDASFTSSNADVATVEDGNVKAVGLGEATITVTYGDFIFEVTVIASRPFVEYPNPTEPTEPEGENPGSETPEGENPEGEEPEGETPTVPDFSDIANTFAANEINALVAKGIFQGKSETEFAPNAQITRAEFAVLLARALDLPLEEFEGRFEDVNTSKKWAFAGVEAAARAGIINGANGNFNPDAPVKREEIAAMIIRAIEYQNKEKLTGLEAPANFGDHGSIGTFAIDSVYKAAALGVIQGNNGNFVPKNNATRAEAAVMLYRALELLGLLD